MKAAPLFTKPPRGHAFAFSRSKAKTEASIWRGSTKDIHEAAARAQLKRQTAPLVIK